MKFVDILKRYHISPLKYEDDRILSEKDYRDFFVLLTKYYASIDGFESIKSLFGEEERKILFLKKNSLLPVESEEVFDILMGQDISPVINDNEIVQSKIENK